VPHSKKVELPGAPLEMLLLLALAAAIQGVLSTGGYSPVNEIGASSKVHQLAAFALSSLQRDVCSQANSIVCARLQTASVSHVSHAQQQVVSGMNYRIVCETSAGTLTLALYEQVWSDTLVLNSASLEQPVGGASLAIVTLGDAIEEGKELRLDAKAFKALAASNEHCTGGAVFKECASPCTRTCADPAPMCVAMCAAKCECPQSAPVLKDGKCVTLSECSACVPDPLKPCPRIFKPVCADGTTYANSCLAEAECKKFTEGACAAQASSALLVGGAPITAETYGGHYTGTDAARSRSATSLVQQEVEEHVVLERTSVSERASFIRAQQAVGVTSAALGAALLLMLGVVLVRRAGAIRRGTASEVIPMRSAEATRSDQVVQSVAMEDKAAELEAKM